MKLYVQFTSRKRDRVTGERGRWRHGPYATLDEALEHARKMRKLHGSTVRVEVPVPAKGSSALHALRTRAGMARARAAGKRVGRPRRKLDMKRVRMVVNAWSRVHGRTEGLKIASRFLKASVSTLKRALRRGSKGVTGNPRSNAKGAS